MTAHDAHGSYIDAAELPKGVRPPFRGRTVWECLDYRGWHVVVRRIEGDPVPHVVASGFHPSGSYQAHAKRLHGATPATVRAWVDELLDAPAGDA